MSCYLSQGHLLKSEGENTHFQRTRLEQKEQSWILVWGEVMIKTSQQSAPQGVSNKLWEETKQYTKSE